jgi:hypothetical protein
VATLPTPSTPNPGLHGLLERLGPLKWVMLALVVVGAGLIVLGAFEGGYFASVLLQIGGSLFLVVPFIFLERVTTSRISALQESVESVESDVESIRQDVQATADLIAAARDEDSAAVQTLRKHPSQETAQSLLRRAQRLDALSPRGVRVRLPDGELRLRFERSDGAGNGDFGAVRLSLETRDGDQIGRSEEWSDAKSIDEALADLAYEAQRAGQFRSDASFDAAAIFDSLARTLDTVISLRTGARSGSPLDPVVELIGDWAITSTGFQQVGESDVIRAVDLFERRNRLRTELLADDPAGEGAEAFSRALETAVDYHLGDRRRQASNPKAPN